MIFTHGLRIPNPSFITLAQIQNIPAPIDEVYKFGFIEIIVQKMTMKRPVLNEKFTELIQIYDRLLHCIKF